MRTTFLQSTHLFSEEQGLRSANNTNYVEHAKTLISRFNELKNYLTKKKITEPFKVKHDEVIIFNHK